MLRKKDLVFEFFGKHSLPILLAFVFGLLSIFASVFIPVFLGKFYQLALHNSSARGKIFDVVFGHINSMRDYFLFFALLLLGKFAFNYGQKFSIGLLAEQFTKALREKLFSKQLVTHLQTHQRKETGKYLLRYSGDLSAIHNYITKGIIGFINDCFYLALTACVFFLISPALFAVIAISYPFIFGSVFLLNKKLKRFTRKRRNIRSQNLSFVSTRLNALLTIKVFNRERVEADKFEKKSTDLYNNGVKYYRWYALINSLLPLLLYSMLGGVLLMAWLIKSRQLEEIQGSQILIFIMLTTNTIPVFRRVLNVNIIWQTADISFQKLLNVLNAPEEDRKTDTYWQVKTGSIRFENVTLGFDENESVLQNYNAHISGFGIYLLKGAQGAGKTLLFKLIMGLYDLDEGQILIDGTNIAQLSKHTLRKNVTMVSDELPLIGNTVFEVISYSRKEEKRKKALELLNILGFTVAGKEDVLDAEVIEGGRNFSSGQRKLLMIIRALLTNKKIILLDEPFYDLDAVFRDRVISILKSLKNERTIIIIDKDNVSGFNYTNILSLERNLAVSV